MRHLFIPLLAAATLVSPVVGQERKVDKDLPKYRKIDLELAGDLNAVGSDTMVNLMTLWGEKFRTYYPGVRIQVEGKGSSTAPPALSEGTSQLGPMSRAMKDKEIDAFVKERGYEPTLVRTSLDALAIFVHKDNPVEGLTLRQVDAIFGKARKLGGESDARTWGDAGLGGKWAKAPISLYGRNSASGTYGYFKQVALGKGDYKDTVKEQPGSASVVQSVTTDLYGIGYSGIGYKTSGVRAVPLGMEDGRFFEATLENVVSRDYPLGRFLNLYINKTPNEDLDPLRREFLTFILSKEGQEIVIKSGYLPIPARIAAVEREGLGIVASAISGS